MSHAIPESSFLQISAAANWVEPGERSRFLRSVADDLAGVEVGAAAETVVLAFACATRRVAYSPLKGSCALA
jgi:hypothetical protein